MENIERYIEENIANIKPFKNGSDELVLVDITTKEVIEKGNIKEMLSRSYVQDVINYNLNEKTETVEEPVQEETVEATEEVDVNSVIDNVIEEDKQEMEEAINPAESVEEQDDLENIPFDDEDVYDEHEIVEEYALEEEKKSNLKKKIVLGLGVVGVLAALALVGKACGKENLKASVSTIVETVQDDNENTNDEKELPENDTPDNTVDEPEETVEETVEEETVEKEKTLDEKYAEDRYIEITEEDVLKASQDFKEELASKNIIISDDQANQTAIVVNSEILAQKNPEVIENYVDSTQPEAAIGVTFEQISNAATLETTVKDDPIDWTVIFVDEADKEIAKGYAKLINDCKEIARSEATNEEKTTQISELIETKYCNPMFDHANCIELEDGTMTHVWPTLGAETYIRGYVSLVLVSDNEIANYLDKKAREHCREIAESNEVTNDVLRELRGSCISR